MFNKRKNSESSAVLAQLAAELARLSARRDQLSRQLVEAQATLDAALAQRRRELLEDDPDGGSQGKDKVLHAREEIDALSGARAVVEERITATEARLAQARDQAARDAAITDLSPHVDALAKGIAQLQAVTQMLAPAAKEVTQRVPYGNGRFSVDLADILGAIADELASIVANARQHLDRLRAGEAQPRAIAVPEPPAPPPPKVERLQILVLNDNIKWTEPGGTVRTAPRYGYTDPPRPAAARAIAACLAVPADGETARRLREGDHHNAVGNSWHQPAQHLCIDIDRDDLRPARGAIGQSLGMSPDPEKPAGVPGVAGAVERIEPERTGVATAAERVP
jgi:hypothetical protein